MDLNPAQIPLRVLEVIQQPDIYCLRLAHRNGKWEAQIEIAPHCSLWSAKPGDTPNEALKNLEELFK